MNRVDEERAKKLAKLMELMGELERQDPEAAELLIALARKLSEVRLLRNTQKST